MSRGVATLDALLLCDAASRDAQTGKWTLVGVFDAVWASEFPAIHPRMDVYFRVRTSDAVAMRLVCRAPDGSLGLLATIALTPPARGLVEGAVRVTGLRLAAPGDHQVALEADGGTLGTTVLTAAALPSRGAPLH
ncbi:MAG TPA: hypothetical protein VNO26_13365 [Candidatus Limnocylindria bacterium]|nr:hypothetical protein [Candidatus Limnocylindria bacterium]